MAKTAVPQDVSIGSNHYQLPWALFAMNRISFCKCLTALLGCSLLAFSSVAAFSVSQSSQSTVSNSSNNNSNDIDRRQAIRDVLNSVCGIAIVDGLGISSTPGTAAAANLPTSTGADMSRTGTLETLLPLVKIENALLDAKKLLIDAKEKSEISTDTIKMVSNTLSTAIPSEQTLFKRRFDEYSDPVSYKQKFMDQNAFLVYYTKGFDGPNRPPMETINDAVPRQSLQYGLRNDAWAAMDDVFAEISFYLPSSSSDVILEPLDRAIAAFEAYFSYAPAADVDEARRRLR